MPVSCGYVAHLLGASVIAPKETVAGVYDAALGKHVGFAFFNTNASTADEWVYTWQSYNTGRGTVGGVVCRLLDARWQGVQEP